ncbi:unnamed protein product [Rotaria sp. Silwood1]|nr:unnamed protein product [Rotaria sp. Silwood1]CAF3565311.1 unnamed protein product [Rotaria sp. Silwood1]CAF3643645.1 unnamed protein product [Rotaria sp. Silwood1]
MSTLMGKDLFQRISSFNNEYYCIIEKIEFYSGIIRIYIDERGDNSLGPIQNPMSSALSILNKSSLSKTKNPIDGKFSINDESRQYLGYLDFPLDNSFLTSQYIIGFQYGGFGYSTAKLFRFDQELINRYHIQLA